jgi:hypothetical protein
MASKVFVITDVELKRLCATFMRLVADHGTFNRKQILAYIEGQRRRALNKHETSDVLAYVQSLGAKPGWDNRADLYHFKPTGRRPPLPKGKRDKRTIDMFTGRTGA